MKAILVGSVIILIILLTFVINQFEFHRDHWDNVILKHQHASDSLRAEIDSIVRQVQTKDSLLLGYMASLDNALESLKKEAVKNGNTFRENLALQDSIRLKYCEEMTRLDPGYKPSDCK